jgi:hypothetical protein
MFITWGTKVVKKRLGRVADFCPICRDLRPFDITKLDSFSHIYGIPVSHGATLGFRRRCERCTIELDDEADAHEYYSRDRDASVGTLMATAGPRLRERMRHRLAQEKCMLAGGLSKEERAELLMEPFLCLNAWTDGQGRAVEKDRASTRCLLGALVLPILILCLSESTRLLSVETERKAAIVAGIAFLLAALYLRATVHGRFARRVLIPRLAETLGPLRPSNVELDKTIGLLKNKRLRIGKAVNPRTLFEAIHGPAS